MKKIILNSQICIDEIENFIVNKKQWEVVERKYDFYQPYVSVFDKLNYEAKIDYLIVFKTKAGYYHKLYIHFLDLDTDNVFKISEIKSKEHPQGQITTRVADFKYNKTTGNRGFVSYLSSTSKEPYNLSHSYNNLLDALVQKDTLQELSYVCILLKYHNHARRKKKISYFVNSYQKFIKSWLPKIEKFEKRKLRALIKAQKKLIKNKKKLKKSLPVQTKPIKTVIKPKPITKDTKSTNVVKKSKAKAKNVPNKNHKIKTSIKKPTKKR